MEQVQIQAPKIRTLLDSSNHFYQDLLGYSPEQTSLQQIPNSEWSEFAIQRGLNPNSSGIYLPRNQTAIIRDENSLSLFHEYFGHGLYCEQSLTGKKLVDLEKRLLEEEKQEFSSKRFSLEDLQKFRKQNQTFQELENFRQQNLGRYELFAIWTEYLLSKEHDLKSEFGRKYDSLQKENRDAVDSIINFSERYGGLATSYAQGMARRTTPKRVKRLLEEIYGIESVNNSRLILLTGSKKPFSDIDLFSNSNYLQSVQNDWLDSVVFDEQDFERRVKLFEIQVTHPIMVGEFVAGDEDYLKTKKHQLINQPITEEAINHNFSCAKRSREYSRTSEGRIREDDLSYAKSYEENAIALRNGLRLLTIEELNSQDLKGGNRR